MRGVVNSGHNTAPHDNSKHDSGTKAARRQYLDLKALQEMAASLKLGPDVSLNELIRISEDAIQESNTLTQQGQLDLALVQYLRASDVVVNTIPNHPDFSYMKEHHPRWTDHFAGLMANVNSHHANMENIKQKIASQNKISNSEPQDSSSSAGSHVPPDVPIRMPSPSSFQRPSSTSQRERPTPPNPTKPEVKPKPDYLTRKPIGKQSKPDDPLADRFAGLRNAHRSSASVVSDRNGIPANGYLPSKQRPLSQGHPSPALNPPPTRPIGPRDLDSKLGVSPAIPPKVPIGSAEASLPQYPSPAYSPAWTIPSKPPSNPPRTSTESVPQILRPSYNTPYRQSPTWGAVSDDHVNIVDNNPNPYRSRTPNGAGISANSTSDISTGPTISAEQLMDYLRKYEVLLIDVRPRDQYDHGHIYAKSIMCIEPIALKENVSAEELEDRLIISPEGEQALFCRRNEFDLIVYYDEGTREPSYLAGSPAGSTMPHLRALYDTLYEFNMYKPLKDGRQPALLAGGLNSWVDLVGPQSLGTSQTAAIMSTVRGRRPAQGKDQPLRRFPTASANSIWEVKKRRLRDHKPIDAEEERIWLEKARNEEIDANDYGTGDGAISEEPESLESTEEESISSYFQTYEDFLRRFPEPNDIRQSMAGVPLSTSYDSTNDSPAISPPSRPPPAVPRPSYSGVADSQQIQPPLARQASASKHALYRASSTLDRLKPPRTGLINFGATCYMNSIIQSLSATTQLTKFFIDNRFHTQVQKNWKGSQGILPGLYANLIRSLWKNDVEVIRPTSFRKFIGRLNSEWAGNQQQDAKEFFDVLVDCLHEDLNLNWQRTQLRPLTFEQEVRREQMPISQVSDIEWNRYCHRELSYISSLFGGQHASRLRCTTCRRTSTTYEAFYSISVEVPPSGPGDIYQCLRSYCQEEMLRGDEVWKCPYCRKEREATKQIILTRAPRFLLVHFKRFSASRRQQARKIHSPVYFPLTGLDMSPFMIHSSNTRPSTPKQEPNGTSTPPTPPQSELTPHELSTSPPYIYNAYSVVRHLGSTIHEGHYISLSRDSQRNCWRKFDDHRVTDFQPSHPRAPDSLQNEQAYLVFYERVPAN